MFIKIVKHLAIVIIFFLSLSAVSIADEALTSCDLQSEYKEISDDYVNNVTKAIHDSLDLTNNAMESGSWYQDPSVGGCDLGLNMPGLPSFDKIGFDFELNLGDLACKAISAVTHEKFNDANEAIHSNVSEFEELVNDSISEHIGEFGEEVTGKYNDEIITFEVTEYDGKIDSQIDIDFDAIVESNPLVDDYWYNGL